MDFYSDEPQKKKGKRSSWTKDEELQLLHIWEKNEGELRKCKRNSHIYAKMAKEMGGKFSAQEVHTKINNFAQKYRWEKKESEASGGSPSQWAHFAYVHKIIGSNVTNNSNSTDSFSFVKNEDDPLLNTSVSSPAADCSAVEQIAPNNFINNVENPAISLGSSASSMESNSNPLLNHPRPQTANHEEFISYVSLSLGQIKNENLLKRAKCQIQLVLTQILAEHAERELELIESEENYNVNFNRR